MNIICNNCVGSRIYQYRNIKYNNQFIWSSIDINDFIYLINNYNNINFNNFKLLYEDNKYFIKIDNKILISYPHYKKNLDNMEQIIVENENEEIEDRTLYSPNIENYIISKYKERFKRNIECPIFLIIDYDYNEKIFEEINTNYTVYIFTKKKNLVSKYNNIRYLINNSENELKRTGDIAKYILNKYEYIIN